MPNVLDRSGEDPMSDAATGTRPPDDAADGMVAEGAPASMDLAAAPVTRPALVRAAPFTLAGLGLLAAFAAVYAIAVLTEAGQRIENLALLGAAIRTEAERGQSAGALQPISVVTFGLSVFAIVGVGVARRRPGLGVLAAGVMVVAVLAAELFKDVLPRPALVEGPVWLLRNSFPSGTVAVVAATAVGALMVSPDRLRWAVLATACVGLAVAAQSTQVAGWHRLSDAVGSGLLVAAVGAFGVALLAVANLVADSAVGRINPRVYTVLLLAGAILLAIGTLLLGFLAVFPLLSEPEGGRRVFLQTTFPLYAAALTPLTLVLFARLIEGRTLGGSPPDRSSVAADEAVD